MFLNGNFGCAGTLIGKDTVLTAAHCLGRDKSITVGIGSDKKNEGERLLVAKEIIHPKYDSITDEYDIGLLVLKQSTSNAIPLPQLNNDNAFPTPGSTGHVMGWGDMDDNANRKVVSDALMIVDLEVISNGECEKASGGDTSYANWIFDDMICTSTEGHDACQGDSGEYLVVYIGI
mmetsp:Transcript_26238/g.54805  ORF Transcript_26238/g.54805 Transcript_26238/m.54805 type:complete len:176 (-) Transcript_26238:2025-2552(-)